VTKPSEATVIVMCSLAVGFARQFAAENTSKKEN
jgi:hypothetical protein